MPRVIIADSSLMNRWAIRRALAAAPEARIVGETQDARQLMAAIRRTRAQALIVDAKMLDGQAPLIKTIIAGERLPVVVLADTSDPQERALAGQVLAAGAARVLPRMPKPSSANFAPAAARLIAAVRTVLDEQAPASNIAPVRTEPGQREAAPNRARIVAIASSTGGPQALQELLAALPGDFPLPILAVQHLARGHADALVSVLTANCPMRVKLAQDRDRLHPGTVYVAPDDYHLGVADRHTVELSGAPPVGGFRPSATWLFSSVAHRFGAGALAVILTGMGRDGVAGLAEVRRAGGLIVAQDEASSVEYGMPRAAVQAGLTDFVLPLEAIAGQLIALT